MTLRLRGRYPVLARKADTVILLLTREGPRSVPAPASKDDLVRYHRELDEWKRLLAELDNLLREI